MLWSQDGKELLWATQREHDSDLCFTANWLSIASRSFVAPCAHSVSCRGDEIGRGEANRREVRNGAISVKYRVKDNRSLFMVGFGRCRMDGHRLVGSGHFAVCMLSRCAQNLAFAGTLNSAPPFSARPPTAVTLRETTTRASLVARISYGTILRSFRPPNENRFTRCARVRS
jgi:hypothetical protein